MEILGIITARKNSKRIPHKNVKLLCGKPLIAYTFEAVKKSRLLNRVILSSDDDKAIGIAREYEIEVPFKRPDYLATDDAKSIDVAIHAVKALKEYDPDIVVIIEPTSPLRTAEDIDELLRHHKAFGWDSLSSRTLGIFSVKRDVLMKQHSLRGNSECRYFDADDGVVDINTEEDWKKVERIIQSNSLRDR